MYFARLYEAYIKKHNLAIYGRSLVRLPMPQFIIFYNGRENQPDELILKLSDAFIPEVKDDEPVLECRAKMLNINYGHNKTLLDNSAIDDAVNHCINENILADILIKCRSEVASMLLTEFDEKLYKKTIYNEGYEDGVRDGIGKGIDENISKTIDILKSLNLSDKAIIQMISERYDIPKENISKMLK